MDDSPIFTSAILAYMEKVDFSPIVNNFFNGENFVPDQEHNPHQERERCRASILKSLGISFQSETSLKYAALHDQLVSIAGGLLNKGWLIHPLPQSDGFRIDYSYCQCGSTYIPVDRFARLVIDESLGKISLLGVPSETRRLLVSVSSHPVPLAKLSNVHQQIDLCTDVLETFHYQLLRARRSLLDQDIYSRILKFALQFYLVEILQGDIGYSFVIDSRVVSIYLSSYSDNSITLTDRLRTLFIQQKTLSNYSKKLGKRFILSEKEEEDLDIKELLLGNIELT